MTNNSPADKPPAIFLMGPTASGKTDLAIALRAYLPVELISVDSALIYRGMDIGTAKPSPEILNAVPHRMIDIRDPAEAFSVADFLREARQHMAEITAQGRIPLLVGGSMLYFRALLDGLAEIPAVKPEIRLAIEQRALEQGWPVLHAELKAIDPAVAATIHPNHSRRIQRALEVFESTGKTISYYRQLQSQGKGSFPGICENYRTVQIALLPGDRTRLHQAIGERFKQMLNAGFEQEVQILHRRNDLNKTLPSMRAVGYQQMWLYLDGDISYDEMLAQGVAATRQLAKRQFTWLRKWNELYALSVDQDMGNSKILQHYVDDALKILTSERIYNT